MEILFWAVLIVIFVIAELITVQLVSIWLAAAALITMICTLALDGLTFIGQATIFTVISAVLLMITIPLIRKRRSGSYIATNSELEIGKMASVIEAIDLEKGTGRVTLNGIDWGAVSENGEVIPKGSTVTVTAVKGTKLEVKTK